MAGAHGKIRKIHMWPDVQHHSLTLSLASVFTTFEIATRGGRTHVPDQQRGRTRTAGDGRWGRKSWLLAGSDRGGRRATVMYTLIVTAKMNDVDLKPGSRTCWCVSPRSIEPGCTSSPWNWKANGTAAQAA